MTPQTKVSAKGQVVIPKDVRDRLDWSAGTALDVEVTASGVTLRRSKPAREQDFATALARLQAIIKYDGPVGDDQAWSEAIGRMVAEDWRGA